MTRRGETQLSGWSSSVARTTACERVARDRVCTALFLPLSPSPLAFPSPSLSLPSVSASPAAERLFLLSCSEPRGSREGRLQPSRDHAISSDRS